MVCSRHESKSCTSIAQNTHSTNYAYKPSIYVKVCCSQPAWLMSQSVTSSKLLIDLVCYCTKLKDVCQMKMPANKPVTTIQRLKFKVKLMDHCMPQAYEISKQRHQGEKISVTYLHNNHKATQVINSKAIIFFLSDRGIKSTLDYFLTI